jgi:hypothetical protein
MIYEEEDYFMEWDNIELIECYEPTEEELDEYYRQKAEKYWENKW